jgi:hypothetical protein
VEGLTLQVTPLDANGDGVAAAAAKSTDEGVS